MNINILVIDDEYDKRVLEELQDDLSYEINKSSSISLSLNLSYENPMKFIDLSLGPENYLTPLFHYLDGKYLSDKLDMFLCDFNLHSSHKHIAFHIINHVREKNKACTIILFSGSPLKELIRLNNNDLAKKISEHIIDQNREADIGKLEKKLEELRKEEEPAEELMQMAVKSNIAAIVSRTKFEEKAIELISNPSIILWIENELLKNGKLKFNDGNEKLNQLSLKDIAKHIRQQSEEGIYFTKQIIEMSIANAVILNS